MMNRKYLALLFFYASICQIHKQFDCYIREKRITGGEEGHIGEKDKGEKVKGEIVKGEIGKEGTSSKERGDGWDAQERSFLIIDDQERESKPRTKRGNIME